MRTIEPTKLTQGERVTWERQFDDYPASLYTLEYRFAGTGTHFNVTCTASGDKFEAVLVVAANQKTGLYQYQPWITEIANSANTFNLPGGYVTVRQGFATAGADGVDLRTPAKIMLDAIDAALATFVASDVAEYEISTPAGMRRVKRSDRPQLLEQRKYWASIVQQEQAKERVRNGGSFGQQIGVRFRG